MQNEKNLYSLMILAKSKAQYNEILPLVQMKKLGLYLIPYHLETKAPIDTMLLLNPNVVIIDDTLLTNDSIKLIQKNASKHQSIRYIVLYGEGTNASHISIQLGTCACLSKDTLAETLYSYLEQAVKRLSWHSKHRTFIYEATRYYFNTIFLQTIAATESIRDVNDAFGFTFQEGLFRVLIVKLDYDGDAREVYGHLFSLQKRIEETLHAHFINCCHEIVLCRTFDGVIMTQNFSPKLALQVSLLINQSFREIQDLCSTMPGINATLCLGNVYDHIAGVVDSRHDAHSSLWARMVLGRNKTISLDQCSHLQFPLHLETKYDALRLRTQKAVDALDIGSFETCLSEIFDESPSVLGSPYLSQYLHDIMIGFFTSHKEEIAQFTDVEILKNKTVYMLVMAPNIKAYHDTLLSEVSALMEKIIAQKNKDFSLYVQAAIAYVKKYYDHTITLSDIADHIGISTSYLSSTFKTETGTGLSNYISFYRIQTACRLLLQTNETIAQIAASVNIEDTTYFTKQFKKYVGSTPSEYRKNFS